MLFSPQLIVPSRRQVLSGGGGASYATFDPATADNVTLSGGNLVVTNNNSSTDEGARVAPASAKTSGKYYFEFTITSISTAGGNQGVGAATTASTYTNLGNNAATGSLAFVNSGNIYANGSSTGKSIGTFGAGKVVGVALDLDNLKVWFKVVSGTPGDWNNDATANPATDIGGVAFPSGTISPVVTFGSGGSSGNVMTGNFGASAFVGSVPAGFTSGWPA